MNDLEKYGDSGILELYVYGLLSEKENIEVTQAIQRSSELKTEVEEIEEALMKLSADYCPRSVSHLMPAVKQKKKIRSGQQFLTWISTAAAVILVIVSGFLYFNNQDLETRVTDLQEENFELKEQILQARGSLAENQALLDTLRSRNIIRVPLNSQEIDPDAYAVGYLSEQEDQLILDAQYLPEPPRGMVYQVWSLKFDPLTPYSIGLLENFSQSTDKIFLLHAHEESQGFGITLEPAGGSPTPTLERLYVLGTISS